jgi:hypothetical protein
MEKKGYPAATWFFLQDLLADDHLDLSNCILEQAMQQDLSRSRLARALVLVVLVWTSRPEAAPLLEVESLFHRVLARGTAVS